MFSMNVRDYDQSRSLFKIEVPEQFNFGFDVELECFVRSLLRKESANIYCSQ